MQTPIYTQAMLPSSIEEFADALRLLPGVGKRSGQKLALDLLSLEEDEFNDVMTKLHTMRTKVRYCEISGVFSETPVSPMLTDPHRIQNLICVVEEPTDVLSVEKSGIFQGTFHVLFRLINPLENSFVENTTIPTLLERLQKLSGPVELVFFLRTSFAADATVAYIRKAVENQQLHEQVRCTRLAQGLPLHFSTEYLDQATMIKAFEDRREIV